MRESINRCSECKSKRIVVVSCFTFTLLICANCGKSVRGRYSRKQAIKEWNWRNRYGNTAKDNG